MKKVAAIVVTYNRKDYLVRNIEAILGQKYTDFDVLVIDNASTDNTYETIVNFIQNEKVIYKNTGANLGGAGGFNYGMRVAAELGYEFIWIMDDDCLPNPDALLELMAAHEKLNGEYGFLSSVAYWTDGSPCNMNVQKTSLKGKIQDYSSELVSVITATFVSAFFKAETIKEVGLPIKEFFIWSDDIEYTRRISIKYKSYVVNKSKVVHAMKSNNKVNIATESVDRLERYNYLYRNEVYVYRREGIKGFLYFFMRVVLHLIKILLSPSKGKLQKMKVVISSINAGLKFKPGIEFLS